MRPDPQVRPIVVRPLERPLTPEFIAALRDRSVRDRHGVFLAEGLRCLVSAVDSGAPIAGLAVCPKTLPFGLGLTLVRRAKRAGCPVLELQPETFRELARGQDSQGVILVAHQFWEPLPSQLGRHDLWIAVEQVRTPGNLGTLLRSLAAVGGTGLFVFGPPCDRADPFDPSVVRASMGALFGTNVVRTSHRDFRNWRLRWEITALGATGDAAVDYRTVTYRRPTLLVFGEERSGLSEAQRASCDGLVKIPMTDRVDSLNLALAGTVLLYEAYGQRHPVRRK